MIYSKTYQGEQHQMHHTLIDAQNIISAFFQNNETNKLCMVFPSREYASQWLVVPMVLSLIKNQYELYNWEIIESYKKFKPGDKLILNDKAIVEWVGIREIGNYGFVGPSFKTKGIGNHSATTVTIKFSDVTKLQLAPSNRKVLSSPKVVKQSYNTRILTPTENLLDINTYGNKEFLKNNICLISKYKKYESIKELFLNNIILSEYIQEGKINENGEADENCPLLVANNLSSLALYVTRSSSVSQIIIDGYAAIHERGTDFADIDAKKIPTILITDLSENDIFENIKDRDFEFYNFTKERLNLERLNLKTITNKSPFYSFNEKLKKYGLFNLNKEVCKNEEIESAATMIHSIVQDDSNIDLTYLRISLIQFINIISRITYCPTDVDISSFNSKIDNIDSLFRSCRMWLGDSGEIIETCITLFKSIVENIRSAEPDKCSKLKNILNEERYDYIICPTEDEVKSLKDFLGMFTANQIPKIISIADINDDLLSSRPIKAILTGWPKSNNMNRILSSFLFSEITVLFYPFENRYYNSLQRHNNRKSKYVRPTITNDGIRAVNENATLKGFEDLYLTDETDETIVEDDFDILDFELKLDNAQYSQYTRGNQDERIKAKRLDFENNYFVYAAESHKFIVVNELLNNDNLNPNICLTRYESIQTGDVIAFIQTERDVLVAVVEVITRPDDLLKVKKWTGLWKNELKQYYETIQHDFTRLIRDLRGNGCERTEQTIRNWLRDDDIIGPEDDRDLKSIALMTNSSKLLYNIDTVREAIRQMTSWRLQASNIVRDVIINNLNGIAGPAVINTQLGIQQLGSVDILKVIGKNNTLQDVNKIFVNRLLRREFV